MKKIKYCRIIGIGLIMLFIVLFIINKLNYRELINPDNFYATTETLDSTNILIFMYQDYFIDYYSFGFCALLIALYFFVKYYYHKTKLSIIVGTGYLLYAVINLGTRSFLDSNSNTYLVLQSFALTTLDFPYINIYILLAGILLVIISFVDCFNFNKRNSE